MSLNKVPVAAVRRAMGHALQPFDLLKQHEAWLIDTLVETSLSGIDTHGIRLLETYIKELRGGRCKAHPDFQYASRYPAIGLLNADDALGVVAANEAMTRAIALARQHGLSAIAVSHSNHCGATGYYSNRAANEGMIGLAFTNSDALVAPCNGTVALNGTNPIAMSAPALNEDRFSLDASTSQISFLKALRAQAAAEGNSGQSRPADGRPHRLHKPLDPLGGHKGQGLGMMVQILAGVLTGMPFDYEISNLYDEPYDAGRRIGHLFICLDIEAVSPLQGFRERLSSMLTTFRTSPPADPATRVLTPGDAEQATRMERLRTGIPMNEEVWNFYAPHLQATG